MKYVLYFILTINGEPTTEHPVYGDSFSSLEICEKEAIETSNWIMKEIDPKKYPNAVLSWDCVKVKE